MPSTITSQPWARIRSTFSESSRSWNGTTSTSGLSASIVRFAESTFGSPSRSVEWTICRWRFESSTTSGSMIPSRADARGGEVERGRRAEPAGADQEDARLEQALLALLADLGDQEVARVARALRGRQRDRRREREPVPLPVGEAAGEVDRALVAELVERLRREGRAGAALAVDDERALLVRDERLDPRLEVVPRQVHARRAGAPRPTPRAAARRRRAASSPASRSAWASRVEISSISSRACGEELAVRGHYFHEYSESRSGLRDSRASRGATDGPPAAATVTSCRRSPASSRSPPPPRSSPAALVVGIVSLQSEPAGTAAPAAKPRPGVPAADARARRAGRPRGGGAAPRGAALRRRQAGRGGTLVRAVPLARGARRPGLRDAGRTGPSTGSTGSQGSTLSARSCS